MAKPKSKTEALASFREGRRLSAEQLREARRSGVVSAAEPLVSADACRRCLDVRGERFPLDSCTVEMLPPYADCGHEDGCDSTWVEVVGPKKRRGTPKIRMAARRRVPWGGVVLAALALVFLAYLFTR